MTCECYCLSFQRLHFVDLHSLTLKENAIHNFFFAILSPLSILYVESPLLLALMGVGNLYEGSHLP